MEWWQIILAIAAVIGAVSEMYLRVLPDLRRKRRAKRESKLEIYSELDMAIFFAQDYNWRGIGPLEKAFKDAPISKKLYKELSELLELALEYYRWRYECFQVIKSEVIAQSKGLENLDGVFTQVFHSNLENVFGGTEGSVSENIYKAIYKNGLTFDMAKESLLKGHWDTRLTVRDKRGEEKELMFKNIIDSGEFHRFIENLIKLQDRESIRTLRDAQAKFLEKARLIFKEVLNATS